MNEDAMAVSMFWAGLLMVFAPIVFFGTVVGVWWHLRRRARAAASHEAAAPPTS